MVISGQKTFGTTAEFLSDAIDVPLTKIRIKAPTGNTDFLFIGGPAVTATTGFSLDATEEVELEIQKLGDIQIIGGAADQVAEWIASNRPINQSSPSA